MLELGVGVEIELGLEGWVGLGYWWRGRRGRESGYEYEYDDEFWRGEGVPP